MTPISATKHKFYIYIACIALALGLLLFLSACKAESVSTELTAMLESSAATAKLITGNEINRKVQDRDLEPLLGKPKEPEVRIDYEPNNNHTKEDIYNEIVSILEKNKWNKEELSTAISGYYKATFPQHGFAMVAEVQIHPQQNIVSLYLRTVPH